MNTSKERIDYIKRMVESRAFPDGRLDDAVARIFELEHQLEAATQRAKDAEQDNARLLADL